MKHQRLQLLAMMLAGVIVHASAFAEMNVTATGVTAGLAVHIGSTDGQSERALAKPGTMLVHGLALDDVSRDKARRAIASEKLYGLASIQTWRNRTRLPYASNLVNLVVADLDALKDHAPPREEIMRVLAPRGVAYLRQNNQWTKTVKPLPDKMDEWSHWDYDATGNPYSRDELVKPTTSLRWYSGPTTRDGGGTKVGMRIVGGRVFYPIINHQFYGRSRKYAENDLVARDAFNGVLLWKKKIDGTPGNGNMPPRFSLTAVNDAVFAWVKDESPLHKLDAATGKTILTFDDGPNCPKDYRKWHGSRNSPEEIHHIVRVFDGKVAQVYRNVLYVSDTTTGKLLWKKDVGQEHTIGWIVAAEGNIFAMLSAAKLVNNRGSAIVDCRDLIAFDAKTGNEVWQDKQFVGRQMFRMVYHRDSLIVPTFTKREKANFGGEWSVARLRGKDGRQLWHTDKLKGTRGHYSVTIARDDSVFVGQQGGFHVRFKDGKPLGTIGWGQHDNSCADLRAVPGFTFYGLTFINNEGDRITRGQARSICDTGNFPAYGMLFGVPSGCLCAEYINGHYALSSEPIGEAMEDARRLVKGPAFGAKLEVGSAKAETNQTTAPRFAGDRRSPAGDTNAWNIFLGNARRSSATAAIGPTKPTQQWAVQVGQRPDAPLAQDWADNEQIVGPVSAMTVADGKVFVAEPDAHRVVALHETNGKQAWSFTTGARVDSPPTILGELCIFGSRDGWVYCLRAKDGELVWKFFGGLYEKQIGVQSQLESAWPIVGSVLPHEGGVIVNAGRHSAVDGGIQVYKLDPATGAIQWKTRIWTDPDINREDKFQWRNRRLNDLLVSDGKRPCLWITPLKNEYRAGEIVDTMKEAYPVRAVRFSNEAKANDIADATWIWAGNSQGMLSRRVESVGRFDETGVFYGNLRANKIAFRGSTLYAWHGYQQVRGSKLRGPLLRVTLTNDGKLPDGTKGDVADWIQKAPRYAIPQAMILAGERLYLASTKDGEFTGQLHVYNAANGELIHEQALPAEPIRDGLAVANGKLFVSCADGKVICFGNAK